MENNTFIYQYSAPRNREVEAIRKKYLPQEESKMETLKRLDSRVQNAGILEALCLGVIGAMVFGVGLCIGLGALAGGTWLAVLCAILGCLLMIPAYPIYKCISQKTRAALTPEILRLSDEILNSANFQD